MALPTASTPGYTTYAGKVACVCLAQWLPIFQRLCELKGYGRPIIWQLTGGLATSGGTHSKGGAFDIAGLGNDRAMLAREMGAWATWPRANMPIGSSPNLHTHGVLASCPHNYPARYQLDAVRAGYDGLGALGRQGRDPLDPPSKYRSWTQGIAWAKPIIAELEDPLSRLTDQQQLDLYNRVMGGIPDGRSAGRKDTDGNSTRVLDTADGSYILGKIKAGDDGTVSALTPTLNTVLQQLQSVTQTLTALQLEVAALPKAPGA